MDRGCWRNEEEEDKETDDSMEVQGLMSPIGLRIWGFGKKK